MALPLYTSHRQQQLSWVIYKLLSNSQNFSVLQHTELDSFFLSLLMERTDDHKALRPLVDLCGRREPVGRKEGLDSRDTEMVPGKMALLESGCNHMPLGKPVRREGWQSAMLRAIHQERVMVPVDRQQEFAVSSRMLSWAAFANFLGQWRWQAKPHVHLQVRCTEKKVFAPSIWEIWVLVQILLTTHWLAQSKFT